MRQSKYETIKIITILVILIPQSREKNLRSFPMSRRPTATRDVSLRST